MTGNPQDDYHADEEKYITTVQNNVMLERYGHEWKKILLDRALNAIMRK